MHVNNPTANNQASFHATYADIRAENVGRGPSTQGLRQMGCVAGWLGGWQFAYLGGKGLVLN